jgi:hypothetical protein
MVSEIVIGGLYHVHTHNYETEKSFSKNKRTIIKSKCYRPTFKIKVPIGPEMRGACRLWIPGGMKNRDIFGRLQEAYGEGCISCGWVATWVKAFREGHTSLLDDTGSGRPPIPDETERIRAKFECEPYQSGSAMA